jgi:fucose permease
MISPRFCTFVHVYAFCILTKRIYPRILLLMHYIARFRRCQLAPAYFRKSVYGGQPLLYKEFFMKKSQIFILVITSIIFLGLGLITAGIGPILPELARQNRADLASIGAVFTALFMGSLTAQLVAGPIGDKFGRRPLITGGLLVLGLGTLGMTQTSQLFITLACAALAGFGHGAVDLGGNVLIADTFEGKSVSALNLLNVFFGIGAISGPAISSLALAHWQTGLPALWLGAGLVLLSILPFGLVKIKTTDSAKLPTEKGKEPSPYRSYLLWVLAAFLLLYVGIENGVGGWAAAYMQQTAQIPAEQAALVASGFWLALTVGRILATFLGAKQSSYTVLSLSLGCSILGAILFPLSTGWTAGAIGGVMLMGLGFGPIFPTSMAIIASLFERARARAAGLAIALGSLGGMILPWVQGVLLQNYGPLAAALLPVMGLCLMIVLFAGSRFQFSKRAITAAQPAQQI